MDCQTLIPRENAEVYSYLYCIETALRELIIECLKDLEGDKWYKQRVPPDIRENSKKRLEIDKTYGWSQFVPFHQIYYIDFPDLQKIIIKKNNWQDVFKSIFFREEVLKGTLVELEPIRNKIAHNRKLTQRDVDIVKGSYTKICEFIGQEKLVVLVSRCTCATDIKTQFIDLQQEAEKIFTLCKAYKPIDDISIWKSISRAYWFDEDYLDCKLIFIQDFFIAIEDYCQLPHTKRGLGYQIEAWVKNGDLDKKYILLQEEFSNFLAQ
ncbi:MULTISPECIES: Swt1 family HEPN domain-containing protein [unclassified Nostoc]|uniref:Swt1 family HEPN domain-containing protein n=1 Tax=unclassified Nostoc TaxID=2593658 RepID=UPI0026380991|nr:Swt1 family HEPN domain-containing protein [Nostoc sp. S13]MDF5739193.1 Swt1 family HEPN domain-containing protein [Nostoc sp. S13]